MQNSQFSHIFYIRIGNCCAMIEMAAETEQGKYKNSVANMFYYYLI